MSEPRLIIIIVVAVVVVVAIAAIAIRGSKRQRSARLRRQFGPEYDRAVQEHGNVTRAEANLAERERRGRRIIVRSLSPDEHEKFAEAWRAAQSEFVDDPAQAVAEADRLVQELMNQRGYPVGDFERQAEDISVDHPVVVENYRSAHAIAERHRNGGAQTEELREAMVHYRKLYDELLNPETAVSIEVNR